MVKRAITIAAAGIALTGFAAGTAAAGTVEGGTYPNRAACESAGQARLGGTIIGYRCSATAPNPNTDGYYYVLRLETKDANRPCQNGGSGSASASVELMCLFGSR